jgi:hypothetical protein
VTVWATPEQAKTHWADASSLDPSALLVLLTAAQDMCATYAPALDIGVPEDLTWTEDPPGSGLFVTALVDDGSGLTDPATGFEVPERYTLAVILQARELWSAAQRDGDVIGLGEGYAMRSRPLTGAVKALLRPPHGVPVFG